MKTKNTTRFILFTLTLSAMLLSACSGVNIPVTGDNSNVNDSPSTPVIVDNGNNANSNSNVNSNDNTNTNTNTNESGIEIVGVVEVVTEDTVRINGVTYQLANLVEFTDLISVGDQIRFHLILNEDGTFTILQLEIITANNNGNNNANSNDDNSNNANYNDDNGNNNNDENGNDNDDNSNDDNDNDDDNNDNGGNNNG